VFNVARLFDAAEAIDLGLLARACQTDETGRRDRGRGLCPIVRCAPGACGLRPSNLRGFGAAESTLQVVEHNRGNWAGRLGDRRAAEGIGRPFLTNARRPRGSRVTLAEARMETDDRHPTDQIVESSVTSHPNATCKACAIGRIGLEKWRRSHGTGQGKTASGWEDANMGARLTLTDRRSKPTKPIVPVWLTGRVAVTYAKEFPLERQ